MNSRVTEQTEQLQALKDEADKLGIKYHPNIGFDSLQKRVQDANTEAAYEQNIPSDVRPTTAKRERSGAGRQLTPAEVKRMRREEALQLVRVVVSCMNPNKKDWEGEIFSIGNSEMPTQKKYVPFNVEEGWHIPRIMLNMIKKREYQSFITERDHRGRSVRRSVMKKEFNVVELPPLTDEEIKKLKAKQALAAGKVD